MSEIIQLPGVVFQISWSERKWRGEKWRQPKDITSEGIQYHMNTGAKREYNGECLILAMIIMKT
jgi:hypothetical protein